MFHSPRERPMNILLGARTKLSKLHPTREVWNFPEIHSITRECAGKRNLFQRTLLSRCPCLSELPQLCARQYSCHSLKSVRVSASLVGYVSKCPRACLPFQVRLSRATWPVPFPCVDSLKKCDVGFRHGFSSKCTLLKSKITFTNLAYTSNPTIWKVCSVHQQRRGASGRSPPRHSCRWS
jgi:hypothetical protein